MATHKLLVFSEPVAGREDEYNDWYTNHHLDEVIEIPGFVAAERFKLSDDQLAGFPTSSHKYVAIYELDRPPGEPLEALRGELESGAIALPESIQVDLIRPWAFSSISPRVAK